MRNFILLITLFLSPTFSPALQAQALHPVNATLAANGIAAAQAELAGKSDAESLFLQGGLAFLRGAERSMQTRWTYGATMRGTDFPVLRLPVAPNPEALEFEAALIGRIFADMGEDMALARGFLAQIPQGADFGASINITDIWFDVNADGQRQPGESMANIASAALDRRMNEEQAAVIVRFDYADARWLSAYTHLLSGVSEMVAAFDPTAAINQIIDARESFAALGTNPMNMGAMMIGGDFDSWLDYFTMVYQALRQQPDPAHTRAAHGHFLAMIAENRAFWAALAAESDNEAEWIPNKNQISALGLVLPEDVGQAWQAVLFDLEAMLLGDKLVPFWRLGPDAGINIRDMFMNPPPVDIVGFVQGFALLPYMERGPLIDAASWRAFDRMVQGDGLMFAAFLN
ncbi:MAG: hypothetical protein WD046_13995 [Paracoccaceae bacterium]